MKGSKERYLLGQNTTCEFSGQSPLSSYKMTLKQQFNIIPSTGHKNNTAQSKADISV